MKLWYGGVMVSAQRSVYAQPLSCWVCTGFNTSDVKTSQLVVQVSFFLGQYQQIDTGATFTNADRGGAEDGCPSR